MSNTPDMNKEREAFEAWYCDQMRAAGYNADEGIAQLREGNHYGKERVMLNGKWEGWQARASLAASAVETKQYADGTTATGIAPLPKHSPSVQHALRVLTDVESMLGGANGPTIQIRAVLESLAESAGAQEINGQLYSALGNLFSHLGMEGCIDADHAFVWDAMAALKRIDGGVHLDDLAVPVDPDAHRDDMLAAVRLLEAGEWAEHFAKTPFGMRLEDQITKLHNGVAASAGSEPVKRVFLVATGEEHEGEATYTRYDDAPPPLCDSECLYTHPSPPEGAGWRPIASFSEDEADELLAWKPGVGRIIVTWLPYEHPDADEGEGWHEAWSHKRVRGITHGMLPPAPPASEAKGA